MKSVLLIPDSKNEKKSAVASIILHLLLLLILIIPVMSYQYPPPGQKAVLVSFGEPEVGKGKAVAMSDDNKEADEAKTEAKKEVKASVKKVNKTSAKEAKPKAQESKVVKTSIDPEAISLEKKKKEEAEARANKKAAEEAARKAAEEEAQRKAEEEAKKKAEYDAAKKQYGDLFGTGKGNTSNQGNQGDPGGDPDESALDGITTGSGKIGGGLGNRSILFEPEISENSQKQGKVVIKLCVDTFGNVIDPKFTQRGSTTTDSHLINVAIANVKKYKFSTSDIEKQCGSITIEFKVK